MPEPLDYSRGGRNWRFRRWIVAAAIGVGLVVLYVVAIEMAKVLQPHAIE